MKIKLTVVPLIKIGLNFNSFSIFLISIQLFFCNYYLFLLNLKMNSSKNK